jgi:chromosome partitioning protein
VNIATALAQYGLDVLLIDGDEQASAATFAQIRAEQPVKDTTRSSSTLAAGTPAACATLTVADVILIPFQPRSVDLWTASQIGALVARPVTSTKGCKLLPS